jgi:hypothetical protein
MKKIAILSVLAALMTSCAFVSSPVGGVLYTGVKAPIVATSNNLGTKVGMAEAQSILGAIAIGDASIQTAAKSAGITKISHVDYEAFSVLGFFASYKVYVYGE